MHKSRLGTLVIDCQTDDLDAAARFWAGALGRTAEAEVPGYPTYRELAGPADEPKVLVQQVSHPSRVHLDVETDDVEAEARRLEALGARRVSQVKTWWVMESPTGQRFCVVRPQRPDFAERARTWGDGADRPAGPALREAVPVLPVQRMRASVAFYERLGFTLEQANDGWGWAMVRCGACRLMLDQSIHAAAAGAARPVVYLYPEDVVDYHERLRAGIDVPPLEVTFYGMTEFRLDDPDGNRLWVGQERTA